MSDTQKSENFEPASSSNEQEISQVKSDNSENKIKFSLLRKNIKKNLKMSTKDKSLEDVDEVTTVKKKKSKKNKGKPTTDQQSIEGDHSTEEKGGKSKGSVVRKLSLDKFYPKLKGTSRLKEERRATTPDLSSVTVSLKEELKEAELKSYNFSTPREITGLDVSFEGESELSEDYRTPACQSPEGSFKEEPFQPEQYSSTFELSQENLSESSFNENKTTELFSGSEPSLESAIQSGETTPISEAGKKIDISTNDVQKELIQPGNSNDNENNTKIDETEAEVAKSSIKNIPVESTPLHALHTSPLYSALGSASSSAPTLQFETIEDVNTETVNPPPLEKAVKEPENTTEENDTRASVGKTASDKVTTRSEKDQAFVKPTMRKQERPFFMDEESQPSGDKRECLFKILVIGELGTGKTSIIKRYVHEFFSQHYRATIGVDFALKVLNWDQDTVIRLQLWDIAGQERFGNMTRVYYKEAVGAFIVFDVTRSATFDAVLKWKQDLDSKVQLSNGSPIPCVLLANKCDQPKEGPINHPEKIEQFCKENNFSDWFETSAKENINIDQAARSLVGKILQNDKLSQNGKESNKDNSKFPLDGKAKESSDGKTCAC